MFYYEMSDNILLFPFSVHQEMATNLLNKLFEINHVTISPGANFNILLESNHIYCYRNPKVYSILIFLLCSVGKYFGECLVKKKFISNYC